MKVLNNITKRECKIEIKEIVGEILIIKSNDGAINFNCMTRDLKQAIRESSLDYKIGKQQLMKLTTDTTG